MQLQHLDFADVDLCLMDLPVVRQLPHDPKRLRAETIEAAALYLAAGMVPVTLLPTAPLFCSHACQKRHHQPDPSALSVPDLKPLSLS